MYENLDRCYSVNTHNEYDDEQGSERWDDKRTTDEAEVTPRIKTDQKSIRVDFE